MGKVRETSGNVNSSGNERAPDHGLQPTSHHHKEQVELFSYDIPLAIYCKRGALLAVLDSPRPAT